MRGGGDNVIDRNVYPTHLLGLHQMCSLNVGYPSLNFPEAPSGCGNKKQTSTAPGSHAAKGDLVQPPSRSKNSARRYKKEVIRGSMGTKSCSQMSDKVLIRVCANIGPKETHSQAFSPTLAFPIRSPSLPALLWSWAGGCPCSSGPRRPR